jgi:hypothetical protein
MLAAWVLGSLFFVFIFAFVLYVLTTDVSRPETAGQSAANTASPRGDGLLAASKGKQRISRDCQIVFSPTAFVNYPLTLRVVFPMSEASESGSADESPELSARRGFQESDYHYWPQLARKDPQLLVKSGHIEFEAEEAEPTIRVELRFAGESFQAIKAGQEQVLKRDGDTVYSFWLNPLKAQEELLTAVISHGAKADVAAHNGKAGLELTAIPLTLAVAHFPIRLR